ncbi:MAG: thiamine phosphate synthase [Desulfobulbus propionicus]|nr:MAG: thiamine phosphate synthase [Desulfobulbus propionicus]
MKEKTLPKGIYGITAEKFSLGRSNLDVAEAMIKGGVKIIQYREKRHLKDYCEIVAECRQMRELTKKLGATFIVNDFVDIALLVDADGVHVGQEDMSVADVRKLLGPEKIIGLSTHSPQQAQAAVQAGADYIGVGPIFTTQTKEDVCEAVGLEYLEYVASTIPLPYVAIGGIKAHNISEIVNRGAQTVCLVTEIVGAQDVTETTRSITNQILG